jgi:myo-inositol catabolism protein IolC
MNEEARDDPKVISMKVFDIGREIFRDAPVEEEWIDAYIEDAERIEE